MASIRIDLPMAVTCFRKGGLSVKARQETGKRFSTFQAIVFGEAEHR